MDNVINFQDIKKKKIPNKPLALQTPIEMFTHFRNGLVRQLDAIELTLMEFEDKELVYSNIEMLTRPKLDQYISTKMAFLLSHELLKRVDAQVKTEYPNVVFPSVDTHSF